MKQLILAMRLRERAVFDSFVVGANAAIVEQLRASVSTANAANAASTASTASAAASSVHAGVCWLSGPAGVGKSHLLQASCTLALSAGRSAFYLSLSQLLTFGPDALEGWRNANVVALDELDSVIGQTDWERALFALYREAEQQQVTLLVAAPKPPQLLRFALPDLASRFGAALLLALQPLDEADQRQVLQRRARARGLELPDETALYLQRRYRRDLPTLCGLLDTIDVAALQAQRRLTVPFIRDVLAPRPAGPAE